MLAFSSVTVREMNIIIHISTAGHIITVMVAGEGLTRLLLLPFRVMNPQSVK